MIMALSKINLFTQLFKRFVFDKFLKRSLRRTTFCAAQVPFVHSAARKLALLEFGQKFLIYNSSIINILQRITLKKSILKKLTQLITLICFTCFQISIPYQLALANTVPVQVNNINNIPGLVPDGTTNTTTDLAPNGVPINNIAAPSASGVSLNNWYEYNVSKENQVVNNRKGGTVNTNLAGEIYGNPHFNVSGVNEAKIIVQQVTSNNPTNLFGYIEIAGGKSELVIANPNSINIKGAGFINVSRLTLVNGAVNMKDNGEINNFKISQQITPGIIITGVNTPNYINLGLDASKVEYTDIIARSVAVMGDIHAKNELNFKLGNELYDYNSKTIKSTNQDSSSTSNPNQKTLTPNPKPSFALDSSYLGGMYADKISLITSEDGAGVRIRGDLVSNAAEIDFKVKGDLAYSRIDAKTNLNLTSQGKITQIESERPESVESKSGGSASSQTEANNKISLVTAGGNINLRANNFDNHGKLITKNNLNLYLTNDLLNYGTIFAGQNLNLNIDGIVTNDGNHDAQIFALNGDINFKGNDQQKTKQIANLDGGKIISSLGSVNINAQTFNNLAKDNKDVIKNKESAYSRTEYRNLSYPWKNTALWGYDEVKSLLSSKSSYLQASQNINIEADNVTNKSSVINAGHNLNVKATNFSNNRTQFAVAVPTIYQTHWKDCSWDGCDEDRYNSWYWHDEILSSNTASIISAGNQFKIEATKNISIDQPFKDSTLTGKTITYGQADPASVFGSMASESPLTGIPNSNNGFIHQSPTE